MMIIVVMCCFLITATHTVLSAFDHKLSIRIILGVSYWHLYILPHTVTAVNTLISWSLTSEKTKISIKTKCFFLFSLSKRDVTQDGKAACFYLWTADGLGCDVRIDGVLINVSCILFSLFKYLADACWFSPYYYYYISCACITNKIWVIVHNEPNKTRWPLCRGFLEWNKFVCFFCPLFYLL